MHWRQNPERLAWFILITCFVVWSAMVVAVPLWVRDQVIHATRIQPTIVTAQAGTVQLWTPRAEEPNAVTERRSVPEGSRVITDDTSRALLTVTTEDDSQLPLLTLQLFQASSIQLEQARTRRYGWSREPNHVDLVLDKGRISLASSSTDEPPILVKVTTPNGVVNCGPGTFYIEVQDGTTSVTARFGTAQVVSSGSQVTANIGQRVDVKLGQAPLPPVPAAVNLVRNGGFDLGLTEWKQVQVTPPGLQPAQITLDTSGQRRFVRFLRRTEDGAPSMGGITQNLNKDVQGFESVVLRMDLQLLYQSVPGGGAQASEYPVQVDVSYTDIYGKDLHWYQGFYYLDVPPAIKYQPPSGERIPLGAWYTYESPDLFQALRDTRPARINSITVSASGHDYESLIADVALIVR
jgi:hypothetical protein